MKIFVVLLTLTSGLYANANTVDCSSYNSKLTYHFDIADGGAPRGPIESLEYDGRALISINPFGGANIRIADFILSDTPVWQSTPVVVDDYETTQTLRNLSVVTRADSALVFDELVYCQSSTYVGGPRP